MKKIALLSVFLFSILQTFAQDGFTFFQFKTGYVHKDAISVSLGFDFSQKYHSAYEVTASYLKSFSKNVSYETIFNETDSSYTKRQLNHSYENILLGVQYKPVLIRSKNTAVKFRFGGFIGTDLSKFIASPNIGFEILQSLTKSIDLSLTNNNGYFFWASKPTRWRNTAEIGLRVAL